MEATNEVPPPVRIPVAVVRGAKEVDRMLWLAFWFGLALILGAGALAFYATGARAADHEVLALLLALLAIISLFPAILNLNSLLDWRRDQAYEAARKFRETESPLERENDQAMSRLRMVTQRTGRLRKAPQFIGTTGDMSYLVISATARLAGKSRHDWVLEVDDEVTVLMARDASVASIEEAFPELVYRQAA